jgi:hypothetical protein
MGALPEESQSKISHFECVVGSLALRVPREEELKGNFEEESGIDMMLAQH